MQVHSQVLHDLQLQISSDLPTAPLQNDFTAHYTNKEVLVFNYSTCKGWEHTSASIQPSVFSATAGPAGSHIPPAAKVIPYLMYLIPLTQSSIHTAHRMLWHVIFTQPTWCWCPLMSSEAHLEAIQDPPNHIVPIQKGIHSGTSTMRWRQQDSSPGDQFYCLPGTSQKACCPLFQSRQGSCFVYRVFSFIWQIELSLSQVQKRNTEKLLYLVSRPSLSGAGDKNRTLKRCSIKPWSSKHLLPSKSTSVV